MSELDLSVLRPRPLLRAEYDRLVELGCFQPEHVALLYGRLVEMSPRGRRHASAIQRLTMLLAGRLQGMADVRVQLPLAVSDLSEPGPDIAIVPPGEYLDEHPRTALLVIEVADSSLAIDRRIKPPLYAQAGVGAYWIINLLDDLVEVHRAPSDSTYADISRHGRGEALDVPVGAGVTMAVAELLPG